MKKEFSSVQWPRLFVLVTGGFSAALGLVGLAGWYTHHTMLTHASLASAPMAAHAALGFFLCGVGLSSVACGWLSLVRIGGGLAAVLGGGTLIQYLFESGLGIDQLSEGNTALVTALQLRMAPTAALGFALSGITLLLTSERVWGKQRSAPPLARWIGPLTTLRTGILGLLGILIALVGLVTFLLYLTGLMTTYGWGGVIPPMAMHTAAGFALLGVGSLVVAWRESRALHSGTPRWLPTLVGASVVATTLLLWQALLVEEHKHIERTIQLAAARVQNEVTVHMDARILALARMAQRWEYAGRPPQAWWEFEARMSLQHFPGYQAIAWVDSANTVRWFVSQDADQTVRNLRVAFEKLGQREWEAVRDQHTVTVTQAIDLVQGGKGFVVLIPLFYDQDFSGFIVGVFGFQDLLSVILKNIAPGYTIAVADDTEEVYRRDSGAGEAAEEWRQELTIDPYGITWRAWVWPQSEVLAEGRSALPEVVLGTGFAMATLLALTAALAQAARQRMRETTVAYLGLTREMAERQRAEQALRKAHAELELRVQERTADLARANENLQIEVGERRRAEEALARQAEELARSNAELEQFAYVASHDLQEPLRKILAFGDRLRAKCSEALGAQGQDYLERMQAAATRMRALITDLLTLSRVTTRLQPFVPVDLSEVAREVVSDMEVHIQQVGGRVHIEPLPILDADPLQMRQLLQNLIGNALKFHRDGEPPVIQVRGALLQEPGVEQNGQAPRHYQIWVEDNGIGFEEKYLDRIFEPFQRLHGRGEYEGTGMGLAICRKIVERHGGEISAQSAQGQGATFIVTLPITQPHGGHRHAKAGHTSDNPHGG